MIRLLYKKIICFAAAAVTAVTLCTVPAFAETEATEAEKEAAVETDISREYEEYGEIGVYRPGDEEYEELLADSKGDPEFDKYYTVEEDGSIVRKDAETVTAMSATLTSISHQSRYKSLPQLDCIDVSKHQKQIDWSKVKAAGFDYVIIRAGHTWANKSNSLTPNQDPYFTSYLKAAYNAGLKVGVYYFSQAKTEAEARTEANAFIDIIEPYKSMITLPAVMDYETYGGSDCRFTDSVAKSLGKTRLTNNAEMFCKIVKANGYTPMVYANRSFLNDRINAAKLESKGYGIWLAHYTRSTNYNTTGFSIWQYSSSGRVSGIEGNVDMNVIYGLGEWVKDEKGYRLVFADGSYGKNLWSAVNGYSCYLGSDGYRVTGLRKFGNYYYGFSPDGLQYKNTAANIGGYRYKFLSNGKSVVYTAKIKRTVYSRKGPSTKYGKAGKLRKNKKVTVIRTYGKWSQMSNGRWFKTKYRKNVYRYPKKI
ncbi:MAG: GH25 family lysozyme [Firmicutes bacterium]|nr:GH25 family lysozyme [Bacillota bacterium]